MTEEVLAIEPTSTAPVSSGESQAAATTTWFAAEAPESEAGKNEEATPTTVSEPTQNESVEGEKVESHEDEGLNEDGSKKEFDKEKDSVPYKSLEKRIDRFNRRLSEKDAEIAALQQKLQVVAPPAAQMPQFEPTVEMFNGDVNAFKSAYSQWATAQAKEAIKRETVVENYKTREAQAKAEFSDYDEQMQDFADDYKHVNDPAFVAYLVESDIGPKLYYHLATNRAETDRILALPPFKRIAELGKLEAKLTEKSVPRVPPKVSAAPNPISSEKGSAPKVKSLTDPNLSQAEYRQLRMATRKRY